jgi:hypothetical protein
MFSGVALVVGTGAVAVAAVGGISFTTAPAGPATAQVVLSGSTRDADAPTSSSTSSSLPGANTRAASTVAPHADGDEPSTADSHDSDDPPTPAPVKTSPVQPQSTTTPTCSDDDAHASTSSIADDDGATGAGTASMADDDAAEDSNTGMSDEGSDNCHAATPPAAPTHPTATEDSHGSGGTEQGGASSSGDDDQHEGENATSPHVTATPQGPTTGTGVPSTPRTGSDAGSPHGGDD